MMLVVFWDKRRETYYRVENAVKVEQVWSKGQNGRPSKFWSCEKADGKTVLLQCRFYEIEKFKTEEADA